MIKFLKKITKNFFYILFTIIYKKISVSIKAENDENTHVEKISKFNNNYKIYKISEARLYTNTIDDLAIISNNKIVEGPSYQLRPDPNDDLSPRNNSHVSNNIVFKIGTPKILKKKTGSVLSLLSGGGANKNYFHWLFDVLPRLSLLEEKIKNLPDYLLVPNNEIHFQRETLDLIGFHEKKILSSKKFRHLFCDVLFVTDHPYAIKNDIFKDRDAIPKWISEWLNSKFLKYKKSYRKDLKKIYIDRDDLDPNRKSFRRILNEEQLRSFLKKFGFEFIKLNEINFVNQIGIFNDAEIIVGLHGAGFANLPFCKKNTKIIEFRTIETGEIIENIAKSNGLNFQSIKITPDSLSDKQNGLINVPINELQKLI